jgi:hypothetical protein
VRGVDNEMVVMRATPMASTVVVQCDQCGSRLVGQVWELHYNKVPTTVRSGLFSVEAVYLRPPFEGPLHFCNSACLRYWLESFHEAGT